MRGWIIAVLIGWAAVGWAAYVDAEDHPSGQHWLQLVP